MGERNFNPQIEEVVLPFSRAIYLPPQGSVVILREGKLLKVCHSKKEEKCLSCMRTSCKFADGELERFWGGLLESIE